MAKYGQDSALSFIQNTATLVFPLFPDEELASASYFQWCGCKVCWLNFVSPQLSLLCHAVFHAQTQQSLRSRTDTTGFCFMVFIPQVSDFCVLGEETALLLLEPISQTQLSILCQGRTMRKNLVNSHSHREKTVYPRFRLAFNAFQLQDTWKRILFLRQHMREAASPSLQSTDCFAAHLPLPFLSKGSRNLVLLLAGAWHSMGLCLSVPGMGIKIYIGVYLGITGSLEIKKWNIGNNQQQAGK